jgi:hypothetical protein
MEITLSQLEMRVIDREIVRKFMIDNHYSQTCPKVMSVSLGFFFEDILTTAIVYSTSPNRSLSNFISSLSTHQNTLELSRLFSINECPKNTESYCIGQSINYIKKNMPHIKFLVSFSDSNWGHHGYVYQATNWMYTGESRPRNKVFIDGKDVHTKTLFNSFGTDDISKLIEIYGDRISVKKESGGKHRYILVVSQSKNEKKKLMNSLKVNSLPYPKGDNKYY